MYINRRRCESVAKQNKKKTTIFTSVFFSRSLGELRLSSRPGCMHLVKEARQELHRVTESTHSSSINQIDSFRESGGVPTR